MQLHSYTGCTVQHIEIVYLVQYLAQRVFSRLKETDDWTTHLLVLQFIKTPWNDTETHSWEPFYTVWVVVKTFFLFFLFFFHSLPSQPCPLSRYGCSILFRCISFQHVFPQPVLQGAPWLVTLSKYYSQWNNAGARDGAHSTWSLHGAAVEWDSHCWQSQVIIRAEYFWKQMQSLVGYKLFTSVTDYYWHSVIKLIRM